MLKKNTLITVHDAEVRQSLTSGSEHTHMASFISLQSSNASSFALAGARLELKYGNLMVMSKSRYFIKH